MGKLMMLVAAVVLSACMVQPKTGTETIRIVGENHGCEVITNVTGEGAWGRSKTKAAEDAVNQVKNRAAAAGANAVHFEELDSRFWGSMVLDEALYCS
jgi:uncharacterized protein YbjQ (UPF0145 family)